MEPDPPLTGLDLWVQKVKDARKKPDEEKSVRGGSPHGGVVDEAAIWGDLQVSSGGVVLPRGVGKNAALGHFTQETKDAVIASAIWGDLQVSSGGVVLPRGVGKNAALGHFTQETKDAVIASATETITGSILNSQIHYNTSNPWPAALPGVESTPGKSDPGPSKMKSGNKYIAGVPTPRSSAPAKVNWAENGSGVCSIHGLDWCAHKMDDQRSGRDIIATTHRISVGVTDETSVEVWGGAIIEVNNMLRFQVSIDMELVTIGSFPLDGSVTRKRLASMLYPHLYSYAAELEHHDFSCEGDCSRALDILSMFRGDGTPDAIQGAIFGAEIIRFDRCIECEKRRQQNDNPAVPQV